MYRIVNSGKVKEVTLDQISRNIGIQSEIFVLSDKEIYLGLFSHKTLVFFATEFANYALQNYSKKKIKEAEFCISLVRKWIEDNTSVSIKELRAAAYVADVVAYAAYYADTSFAAAYASYAAAYAANTAANVTDASYAAASFAADAAGADKDKEYIRQGTFILDFLKTGNHLFLV